MLLLSWLMLFCLWTIQCSSQADFLNENAVLQADEPLTAAGIHCDTVSTRYLDPQACRYIPSRGGFFIQQYRMRYNQNCEPIFDVQYKPCEESSYQPYQPHCNPNYSQIQTSPCQRIESRGGDFIIKLHISYNQNCEPQYSQVYDPCTPTYPQPTTFQVNCDRTPRIHHSEPCEYIASKRGTFIKQVMISHGYNCQPIYYNHYEPCELTQATRAPGCTNNDVQVIQTSPCEYISSKGAYYITKRVLRYNQLCHPVYEDIFEPCYLPTQHPYHPTVPCHPDRGYDCLRPVTVHSRYCTPRVYLIPQTNIQGGQRLIITITISQDCSESRNSNWQRCGHCCGRDTISYNGCRNPSDPGHALLSWGILGSNGKCARASSMIQCSNDNQLQHYQCYTRNNEALLVSPVSTNSCDNDNDYSYDQRPYYLPNWGATSDPCIEYQAIKSSLRKCGSSVEAYSAETDDSDDNLIIKQTNNQLNQTAVEEEHSAVDEEQSAIEEEQSAEGKEYLAAEEEQTDVEEEVDSSKDEKEK